jgi:hypothetical protein
MFLRAMTAQAILRQRAIPGQHLAGVMPGISATRWVGGVVGVWWCGGGGGWVGGGGWGGGWWGLLLWVGGHKDTRNAHYTGSRLGTQKAHARDSILAEDPCALGSMNRRRFSSDRVAIVATVADDTAGAVCRTASVRFQTYMKGDGLGRWPGSKSSGLGVWAPSLRVGFRVWLVHTDPRWRCGDRRNRGDFGCRLHMLLGLRPSLQGWAAGGNLG